SNLIPATLPPSRKRASGKKRSSRGSVFTRVHVSPSQSMEGTRMPTERLSMRRIRQVLQLRFGAHASARVIAREVGVGRTTVQDYLTRAGAAGLGWPLVPDLTDEALEQLLFPAPSSKPGARRYPEADWPALVRELKRPGVSLLIL